MIASCTHDFIFVKTRKVGGTSLEIVLSSWCSGRDICTPIPPEDEAIRAPPAKGGHRRDRRPAREVLTKGQRERIAHDARIEFELLGYEP